LLKNLTVLGRQLDSLFFQILIPLFGVGMLMFMRYAVLLNTHTITNQEFSLPIPFLHNIPL